MKKVYHRTNLFFISVYYRGSPEGLGLPNNGCVPPDLWWLIVDVVLMVDSKRPAGQHILRLPKYPLPPGDTLTFDFGIEPSGQTEFNPEP